MQQSNPTTSFQGAVNQVRLNIKETAKFIFDIKSAKAQSEVSEKEDAGEVMANLMLAYRHLEDASMRLGKVLQAYDGGVSVYDKETTVGA